MLAPATPWIETLAPDCDHPMAVALWGHRGATIVRVAASALSARRGWQGVQPKPDINWRRTLSPVTVNCKLPPFHSIQFKAT